MNTFQLSLRKQQEFVFDFTSETHTREEVLALLRADKATIMNGKIVLISDDRSVEGYQVIANIVQNIPGNKYKIWNIVPKL